MLVQGKRRRTSGYVKRVERDEGFMNSNGVGNVDQAF